MQENRREPTCRCASALWASFCIQLGYHLYVGVNESVPSFYNNRRPPLTKPTPAGRKKRIADEEKRHRQENKKQIKSYSTLSTPKNPAGFFSRKENVISSPSILFTFESIRVVQWKKKNLAGRVGSSCKESTTRIPNRKVVVST